MKCGYGPVEYAPMVSSSSSAPIALGLFLHCRPGFEPDAAAELSDRAPGVGLHGYPRARPGNAFLTFHLHEPVTAASLLAPLGFRELIFARDALALHAEIGDLPANDRITPIVRALDDGPRRLSGLSLEHPDTNEGKAVSRFLNRFRRPLEAALSKAGIRLNAGGDAPRLHLVFPDSGQVYVAFSWPDFRSPWPMGIPRLKFPREAPSRSTLKLEEALKLFAADTQFKPGTTAVDLGAAPGGWTWQLVRRGVRVTAVDNGPMDSALMASGMVEHLRTDAFRFRPAKRVDWLVCDMVEKPSRVAALMGQWLKRGDCRRAVFNLKLPMKKRYAAVQDALQTLERTVQGAARTHRLEAKQLYHDREEITVHVHLT